MTHPTTNRRGVDTACAIVGGGPAGAVLALLLARKNVPVTLLESHHDFDREFRGDSLHTSTMEIMDQIGLAGRLLELPHTKLEKLTVESAAGSFTMVDLSVLKTPFPYVTLMPQARFLEFITAEAAKFPWFDLRMGANVHDLIFDDGACRGLRYRQENADGELRARLVVAADGRFSRMRRLAGLDLRTTSPPIDVLWFRLPRRDRDTLSFTARIGGGPFLAILPRVDHFQLGYVIAKGSYHQVREEGIASFRRALAGLVPEFADRIHVLESFQSVNPLSVEIGHLEQWWMPGLLCIGDAAHVMSPVGGVGINCAVQDAAVAANHTARALAEDRDVPLRSLASVQSERIFPTRVIQRFQALLQNRIMSTALDAQSSFRPPLLLRLPWLRTLPAKIFGMGLRRVRVA